MAESIDMTPEPGQSRDTRLIEQAVRQRWNIPEKFRDAIVQRQVAIAIDPKSSPRESTSAARCLQSMDSLNMTEEERNDPSVTRHEVVNVHVELTAAERVKHRAAVIEMLRAQVNGHSSGHSNGHANGSSPGP